MGFTGRHRICNDRRLMNHLKPAVFLDRDGVIIEDSHYLGDATSVRLVPGAAETIAVLNRAGWTIVIVTNQSGVARGLFALDAVTAVHDQLTELLYGYGAKIDSYYFCPHHPSVGERPYRQDCDCRKPRPGLLKRAEAELGIDLGRSWVVGDRHGDLELAFRAGAKAALVKSGYGLGELQHHASRWSRPPDLVAEHLLEAVERILASPGGAGP